MSLQSIGQNLLNNNLFSEMRPGLKSSKDELSQTKLLAQENRGLKSTEIQEKSKTGFFDQLLNQKTSKDNVSLESMKMRFSELQAKGKLVRSHPLPSVVKDYAKDLKNFLGDLKDRTYQAEHHENLFQRIKVADENLDKLVDETLSDQKKEINIIASLGELQGLLIDVFA
jgi:uncharacterized protein YaaR (DUF327 family)